MTKKIPPTVIYMTEGREDKFKPRGHWTHWTANGTFEIKTNILAGSLVYEVYFQDRHITNYFELGTAVTQLRDGTLDQELGISGKTAGPPARLSDWNNR